MLRPGRLVVRWTTEDWRELLNGCPELATPASRVASIAVVHLRSDQARALNALRASAASSSKLGDTLARWVTAHRIEDLLQDINSEEAADEEFELLGRRASGRVGRLAALLAVAQLCQDSEDWSRHWTPLIAGIERPLVEDADTDDDHSADDAHTDSDDSGVAPVVAEGLDGLNDYAGAPVRELAPSSASHSARTERLTATTEALAAALRATADALLAWSSEVADSHLASLAAMPEPAVRSVELAHALSPSDAGQTVAALVEDLRVGPAEFEDATAPTEASTASPPSGELAVAAPADGSADDEESPSVHAMSAAARAGADSAGQSVGGTPDADGTVTASTTDSMVEGPVQEDEGSSQGAATNRSTDADGARINGKASDVQDPVHDGIAVLEEPAKALLAPHAAPNPAEDARPLLPEELVIGRAGSDGRREDDSAAYVPGDLYTSNERGVLANPTGAKDFLAREAAGDIQRAGAPLPGPRGDDDNAAEVAAREAALEEDDAFPWDAGEPPLLARLVAEGRYAVAVLLAEAASEVPQRVTALRLLTCAFACWPEAVERMRSHVERESAVLESLHQDEARVLLAGTLRLGLVQGWSVLPLTTLLARANAAGEPWEYFVGAAVEAVYAGHRRTGVDEGGLSADAARHWSSLAQRAADLAVHLTGRKTIYAPATNLLRQLARPDGRLGAALADLGTLAEQPAAAVPFDDPRLARLRKAAENLSEGNPRRRFIQTFDRALRGPEQYKALEATALRQVDEAIGAVVTLIELALSSYAALHAPARGDGSAQAAIMTRDAATAAASTGRDTVGTASIGRLLAWWLDPDDSVAAAPSVPALLNAALLPLYELPRDANGVPERVPGAPEVRDLVAGRSTADVVRGYLEVGNLAQARLMAQSAGDHRTLDDVERAEQRLRRTHADAITRGERTAARLRAMSREDAARQLLSQLERHRSVEPDRYDLVLQPLSVAIEDAGAQLEAIRTELVSRVAQLTASSTDKERISARLAAGDEVTALEFLTVAESGRTLPHVEAEVESDFSAFYPRMVEVAARAVESGGDAARAVLTELGAPTVPTSRVMVDGLASWGALRQGRRANPDAFRSHLANVLRMIGLIPRAASWLQETTQTRRAGHASYQLRAAPVDGSSVPQLGTQAGERYELTLQWDQASPSRLLELVPLGKRTAANVILYFGVLGVDARRRLRALTAPNQGMGFSPLVVDEAVVGWLAAREEAGWRQTQRVTLPLTTLNPFMPFAAGEVPAEVFVGRERERAAIEAPAGSMFVYGGRQLGKSTLLRRVETLFTDAVRYPEGTQSDLVSGRVAVYIDLRAANIGEALEPAALWRILAQRLQDAGVLSNRISRGASSDVVMQHVRTWLRADEGNRLLLLLDEADMFLTRDFSSGEADNAGRFPVLNSLKLLMTDTNRRFKPVFAGLHQVQRFHDGSNTPVAHGGDDICIGPLLPRDAYDLVVTPLHALGYELSSRELAWRLLLVTNYQPSLVQIVGDALVRHLESRSLPAGEGRIVVTEGGTRWWSAHAKCES